MCPILARLDSDFGHVCHWAGVVYSTSSAIQKVKVVVKQSQETLGNMISRIQESYEAERIVKINDSYDFEDERFSKVNMRIRRLALKRIFCRGFQRH